MRGMGGDIWWNGSRGKIEMRILRWISGFLSRVGIRGRGLVLLVESIENDGGGWRVRHTRSVGSPVLKPATNKERDSHPF
jgi:hypothetical protein